MSRRRGQTIRASDLSLYGFCPQAWWLGAVRQVPPTNRQALARGSAHHHRHARGLRIAIWLRNAGLTLLGLAVLLSLIWWLW